MVYNFLTIMSTLHVFLLWSGPLIVYIHKRAIRPILAQTKGIVGILDPQIARPMQGTSVVHVT